MCSTNDPTPARRPHRRRTPDRWTCAPCNENVHMCVARGRRRCMERERRGTPGLSRRQVLIGGAVLGAAALGVTTSGSPFSGGSQTVSFWHLFGGGDGERLTAILADIASEHPDSDVRELILPWGNPYYTKLALAAVGGSPPDVAVVHATRLPSFAPAGLLEELTPELLARHGLEGKRFLERRGRAASRAGASTRSRSTPTRSSSTTTPSWPRRRGCSRAGSCPRSTARTDCSTPARRSRRRPGRPGSCSRRAA